MVKHTQRICVSLFDHFVGLALKTVFLYYICSNIYLLQEYRFSLLCKSHIGREFNLKCKGIGVLPPLQLSENLIKFRATAVNDTSTINIFVTNNHLSTNQFTHPVPRIGSGDIFPVGPTSFEFLVPEDAPLVIVPSVGTVMPGEVTRKIFLLCIEHKNLNFIPNFVLFRLKSEIN